MVRAKKTEPVVTVQALRSFDGFRVGETEQTRLTDRVRSLVAGAFLEVVDGGEGEAGPAGADADDSGGGAQGPSAEGAAGAEPSPDPGAGGHGTAAE